MRPHSLLAPSLSLALIACPPSETPDETDSGAASTSGTSTTPPTTGDSASTTTGPSGSTGVDECIAPPGEPLDVLLLADHTFVVRPGDMTCGEPNPNSCDCASEAIDRLVIEFDEPLEVALYVLNGPGTAHVECAMGDDGCSQIEHGGEVNVITATPTCVTGELDFPGVAIGSFAVVPCS